MTDTYQDRRRNLWDLVFDEYRAQWINYRKYYLASDWLGKWGNRIHYLTTIASSLLLAVIGAAATYSLPDWFSMITLLLSAATASLAIVSMVGKWQLKSNQYYNAGQQHQELYKEFDYFVKVRLTDKDEETSELEKEAKSLIEKKNDLNEATPQLHTRWFEKLKSKRDTEWEQPSLEDLREGNYRPH
ncbi:MAG: hypothetical protein ABEH81_14025 [Halopenitus sp.]